MIRRIPCANGIEVDAFSRRYRRLVGHSPRLWKGAKRSYNRRFRRSEWD